MKVKLWGTRGSVPVPQPIGADKRLSLGGNTPCVEVRVPGCEPLVLDAGMGLHWLGNALLEEGFDLGRGRAHLLLTHTHWGHIQGIPFLTPPMLIPGNHFTFYGCGSSGYSLEELLNIQMDAVYCPVPNAFLDGVGATTRICEIDAGSFSIGPVRITARRVNHVPGIICLGYRLDTESASLAYLPDIEYLEEDHRRQALELAGDVDLLIHDAHFTAAEYQTRRGQGHCCADDAVRLAREAEARHLLLFHHHPDRVDSSCYADTVTSTADGLTVEPACEQTLYVIDKSKVKRKWE